MDQSTYAGVNKEPFPYVKGSREDYIHRCVVKHVKSSAYSLNWPAIEPHTWASLFADYGYKSQMQFMGAARIHAQVMEILHEYRPDATKDFLTTGRNILCNHALLAHVVENGSAITDSATAGGRLVEAIAGSLYETKGVGAFERWCGEMFLPLIPVYAAAFDRTTPQNIDKRAPYNVFVDKLEIDEAKLKLASEYAFIEMVKQLTKEAADRLSSERVEDLGGEGLLSKEGRKRFRKIIYDAVATFAQSISWERGTFDADDEDGTENYSGGLILGDPDACKALQHTAENLRQIKKEYRQKDMKKTERVDAGSPDGDGDGVNSEYDVEIP